MLGADFSGFLVRGGWSIYRQFEQALHPSCLAHLLRRCREMSEVASPSAARFPGTVQRILQQALALRDRRDAGQISPHGLAVARGRLEARLDRALLRRYRWTANERFASYEASDSGLLSPELDEALFMSSSSYARYARAAFTRLIETTFFLAFWRSS